MMAVRTGADATRFPGSNEAMVSPNVVSIRSDVDIVAARMAARDAARAIGFGAIDQARIATATSELARIVLVSSGSGSVAITAVSRDGRFGVQIVCGDCGPILSAIDRVLPDSQNVLRLDEVGINGARRLMDEMELDLATNPGTTVTCRKWLR
jgi:serine/threonine-protein kinase RsbT